MVVQKGQDAGFAQEVNEYWEERAQSYSNGVIGELADGRKDSWKAALEEAAGNELVQRAADGGAPRACDLGCGPGFFTILLAEMGFAVDAVDASESMLAKAEENLSRAMPVGDVEFHASDLLSLPFPDSSFDLCVSRNVTWLMRDPRAAYAEWLRVLRPNGKLVAYDANWYRYLVDPDVDAARRRDQEVNVLEGWDEDAQATSDEERRCELFALELPLSSVVRPAWDIETLSGLGAQHVNVDEDAWANLWTESEYAYYATSPLFMVEAVKGTT
jgi:SAM-dependent methyltransferase